MLILTVFNPGTLIRKVPRLVNIALLLILISKDREVCRSLI